MESKEFIDLLTNHDLVRQKSVEELKKLSLEFPYSQPVQLLYAIRLSQSSEYLFNRQLGKTSILTNDRTVLFDLFEREEDNVVQSAGEGATSITTADADPPVKKDSPILEDISVADVRAESGIDGQDEQRLQQSVMETIPPSIPEEKPEEKKEVVQNAQVDENQSLQDKVKAILEENRRLREKYEGSGKANSPINHRISGIRSRLDQIKEKQEQLGVTGKPQEEERAKTQEPETPKPSIPEPTIEPVSESVESISFDIDADEYSADETALVEETQASSEPETFHDIAELEEEPVSIVEGEQKEATVFVIDEETANIEELEGEEHSFVDWLQRLSEPARTEKKSKVEDEVVVEDTEAPEVEEESLESEKSDEQIREDVPVATKFELFDSFVEKLPELKRKKPDQPIRRTRIEEEDLNEEESSLVTETLAKVYVKQKHYDKAIKAYEILRLKYPEKSGFFADRIFEIKTLRNS